MSQRVVFNVGGTRFETTAVTVAKHPGSMLAAMVSGTWATTADADGSFFIDRSPKYFELILDYLRTDELPTLPPGVGQRNLLHEARYFSLDRLVHDLEHLLFPPSRFELYQLMQSRDLSHVDLSGMQLRGKNFAGFKMDYCNLAGADLTECDLTLTTLRGCDLTDACLEGASLRGTDFSEACLLRASLRNAVLSHATKFRGALMDQVDLRGTQGMAEADWTSTAL
eukprot:Unigene10422_Nuclearia_a/m.31858 Unigene10422_Nuclearia_a/g.31858  ORF Unigene10422_Nuclearia_a/g.31858 Unigene10422_Nuclearia_a/m.31858 type:complete len:225 (-) Unigene10422_Nuclearia_a:95-769(-)